MVHSETPGDLPLSPDCAIRDTAWQYGKQLLPQHGKFKSLYDALQVGACPSFKGERPLGDERDELLQEGPPNCVVCCAF